MACAIICWGEKVLFKWNFLEKKHEGNFSFPFYNKLLLRDIWLEHLRTWDIYGAQIPKGPKVSFENNEKDWHN